LGVVCYAGCADGGDASRLRVNSLGVAGPGSRFFFLTVR